MRILLSNVFFAPQSLGGATRVVEDNVSFFSSDKRVSATAVFTSLVGEAVPHSTRHYYYRNTRVQAVAAKNLSNIDYLLSDEVMRHRFSEFLDYFGPDIIHFHCIQRLTTDIVFEAKRRGIPYCITMHDGWWISNFQFLIDETGLVKTYDYDNYEKTLERFGESAVKRQMVLNDAIDGASKILTVSNAFKEVLENSGLRNVKVIKNGVSDIEVLEKNQSDKLTIGYLAGVSHAKGYYQLRAVLSNGDFPNFKLVVVDHSLAKNQSITEYWGTTEIERTGFIPLSEISKLYQKLNVVIVPSLWPESFGLVAREAMNSRCWLLASIKGAASEDIVEGKNGHIFNPNDRNEFSKLLKMMSDKAEYYKNHSPSTTILSTSNDQARKLLELYTDITTW